MIHRPRKYRRAQSLGKPVWTPESRGMGVSPMLSVLRHILVVRKSRLAQRREGAEKTGSVKTHSPTDNTDFPARHSRNQKRGIRRFRRLTQIKRSLFEICANLRNLRIKSSQLETKWMGCGTDKYPVLSVLSVSSVPSVAKTLLCASASLREILLLIGRMFAA